MAEKSCEQKILEMVVLRLDLVVLARKAGEEHFRIAGPIPEWFRSVFGKLETFPASSPFLEDFILNTAPECWKGTEQSVQSGYWEETDQEGKAQFFEATACQNEDEDILLLSLASERHNREQSYLQHVHDAALHQRRLAKERDRKEILLDCIVHDLSDPLTSILMNVQFVKAQLTENDLQRALARAENQAERQRDLIHSISHAFSSDLSPFEPALLAQRPGVPLGELLGDTLAELHSTMEQQGITLEVTASGAPEQLTVLADKPHLARVCYNLLARSIRRAARGTHLDISISERGDSVRLSLPEPATALEPSHETENLDLPLRFCRMAVELWGGRLQEEKGPDGHGIWFELPKHPALPALNGALALS